MMTGEPEAGAVTRRRRKRSRCRWDLQRSHAAFPPGLREEIAIQGRWAYSRQAGPDGAIDMATTPAVQDGDVWLLFACNENGRLSVALMHADRFSFELDESSLLQLQSARLSSTAVVAERSQPGQIVMDRKDLPLGFGNEPIQTQSVTMIGQQTPASDNGCQCAETRSASNQEHDQKLIFHCVSRFYTGEDLPGHHPRQRHEAYRRHAVDGRHEAAS
jgi:hypothetical protein